MRCAVPDIASITVIAREAARRWTNTVTLVVMAIAAISCSRVVSAEEATLKFSFFTSDRSIIYQCQIKPFVDAVNAEGAGLVQIKVYFSGAISPVQSQQPQLVRDGIADLANVAPGYSPQLFPDTAVLELPGLFRDQREASLVFTRLIEAGALKGYRDFFVVGAFVSAGESIHSLKPIARLADLKGQTIRVNNEIEAVTLRKLGAVPRLLPLNRTMEELSKGELDGATVPPPMLFEFGYGRLTGNHYLLQLGGAPVTLLMNRKKLTALPVRAQEIIRKYSGEWMAEQEIACMEAKAHEIVAQLNADRRRTVVEPSSADLSTARKVFSSVVEDWAKESPRHRELLALVKSQIAKLRSPKETHP